MKKFAFIMLSLLIALPLSVAPAFAASFTPQQVSTHNTASDCWAIVNNNVYNLTSFIATHPGGEAAIIALCGTNGSTTFNAIHGSSSSANAALASLLIGTLATADTTAPSVPTNLAASLNSSHQVVLSWTAATDNVGVTGYKVMRNGIALATSTALTFTDITVAANTTYAYSVLAFDAAGNNSAASTPVSITTPVSTDTSAPSVPTNLTASAISSSQINLSWTAATDNVAVTGYNIYRGTSLIGTSASTTFSDTGLTPSTSYSYMVSAFDAAGNTSAQSVSVSSATLAVSSDTTAPTMPTGLAASLNSHNQVVLSWNTSTDNVEVTGYTIMRNGTNLATSTSNNYTDTSVASSTTYSYSVLAFDAAGNNSTVSAAVSITTSASGVNNNPGDNHHNGNDNDNEQDHNQDHGQQNVGHHDNGHDGKNGNNGNNGNHFGENHNQQSNQQSKQVTHTNNND